MISIMLHALWKPRINSSPRDITASPEKWGNPRHEWHEYRTPYAHQVSAFQESKTKWKDVFSPDAVLWDATVKIKIGVK